MSKLSKMAQSSEVHSLYAMKTNRIILPVLILFTLTLIDSVATAPERFIKNGAPNSVSKTMPSATTSTNTIAASDESKTIMATIKDLTTYHFIIVGCGTSGAVLASRLTENPAFRVICIERGHSDFPNLGEWSGMRTPKEFNFISPQDPLVITSRQKVANRLIYIPRAMGLGGTSEIYGMIDVRPSPDILINWPQGWHYDELLPYYKKSENHYCHHYNDTNISKEECELYHGKSGPMEVNSLDPLQFHNISKAFTEICYDKNQPWNGYSADYNGNINNKPHSCSLFQQFKFRSNHILNKSSFSRGSSKAGYLHRNVLERPNLSIIGGAIVTRIVFDDTARAVAVEYFDSITHTVKRINALYEVIIAAGAFGTPHLLQVSGVGDPDHLKKINVTLVANNTHVGKHLADHISVPYIVQLNQCDESFSEMNGPFSWLIQFNSGVRKNQSNNIRDVQIYFMDAADGIFTATEKFCSGKLKDKCNANNPTNATFRMILQNNDFTYGTVQAVTSSIFDKPAIDLGWTQFSDNDKKAFSRTLDLLRSYTTNKSLSFGQLITHEILPGTLTLDEYLRDHIESALHPACSCRLGYCTDEQLIVRGTKSLRVCDASSFGSQIDANPVATIFSMAEKLSDILKNQYDVQQQMGIWKMRDTMLIFESKDIVSSSKIASFDLEDTLITTNPNNNSDWHLLNAFVVSRLEDLHSSGYKIVVFTNQSNLCRNNDVSILKTKLQWQSRIEMIVGVLKVPVQIFTSTCNDDYHKPRTAMWRDFIWLFNDGINVDYQASFYVAWRKQSDFSDSNVQFAANIPLLYYLPEQQFTNDSSRISLKHFNVIQTIRIDATADAVWKLIGGFFDIHKWHPRILATEMHDQQTSTKRRVIFADEMIDTIEQLQSLDNHRREYQYKNVGGSWGKLAQNYGSKLDVMEDNNGRSAIVRWIGSFDGHTDFVTDFYRVGLNSLADLFSPSLPCSVGNSHFNKTLPTIKDRPYLSVYWRQEYNINASELWKHVGAWKGTLNNQLSYESGAGHSFKLPDKPMIYETLLSYDRANYEFVYCMRTTVPRSLPVTNYVSMKKVVSTGPTSSAWIRTGQMIVDDGTTADQAANQVLTDVFVAGGDRLRKQLQKEL